MAESRRLSGNHSVSVLTAYAMVGLGSLIMLAPFYFMFVFATHSKTEIFTLPPPLWPGTAFFENLKGYNIKYTFDIIYYKEDGQYWIQNVYGNPYNVNLSHYKRYASFISSNGNNWRIEGYVKSVGVTNLRPDTISTFLYRN